MAPKQRSNVRSQGTTAPDFVLKSEGGHEVTLDNALGAAKHGIVIFVYPKANTPGCTRQACRFRDAYEKIRGKGFEVFGVSKDKESAQSSWKEKQKLPFHLLCEGQPLLEALGCMQGNSTTRSVFVILKTKQVALAKIKISPGRVATGSLCDASVCKPTEDSAAAALDFVENFKSDEPAETEAPVQPTTATRASSRTGPLSSRLAGKSNSQEKETPTENAKRPYTAATASKSKASSKDQISDAKEQTKPAESKRRAPSPARAAKVKKAEHESPARLPIPETKAPTTRKASRAAARSSSAEVVTAAPRGGKRAASAAVDGSGAERPKKEQKPRSAATPRGRKLSDTIKSTGTAAAERRKKSSSGRSTSAAGIRKKSKK